MIQALKNIAAISLAINYPNKSTQLLNMSPWELHTQEGGVACRSREDRWRRATHPDSAGSFGPCRWASQNSQCFHFTRIILCHLGRGTQEALSTLTLSPFCLIGESSVLCNSIHLNRKVIFFVCFSNLVFTWRVWVKGHEVCQIHSSRGVLFSPFLPFLPPKLQLVWVPSLTVVKTGHLGNWCVSVDMQRILKWQSSPVESHYSPHGENTDLLAHATPLIFTSQTTQIDKHWKY